MAVVFVLLVLCVVAAVVTHRPHPRRARRAPPRVATMADDDLEDELVRYGTPADAARLARQGIDLAALGYRPSDDA